MAGIGEDGHWGCVGVGWEAVGGQGSGEASPGGTAMSTDWSELITRGCF